MYRKQHTSVHQDKSHMTKVYVTSHYLGLPIKASANSQLMKENVLNLSYKIIKRFYEII